MSRTFVLLERALSRRVVIKVLSPELAAGVSVERFKREILVAAQLQHPHLVPVLAARDANGLPWFTMPYVEGESLRKRLTHGPLATAEALSMLRDVARATNDSSGAAVTSRVMMATHARAGRGTATGARSAHTACQRAPHARGGSAGRSITSRLGQRNCELGAVGRTITR